MYARQRLNDFGPRLLSLREFVELSSSWPLRVVGEAPQGSPATMIFCAEFREFQAGIPGVPRLEEPAWMSSVETG